MALQLKNYDPALMGGANIDVAVDLTDITDNNGNEVIEIDGVASAVNFVRATNSATGNNPEFSAQGDDTNVSLQLSPKGTGITLVGDTSTGTVASGSATINSQRGIITTGALTTGTTTAATFDLVNNKIGAASQLFASVYNGTNSQGTPIIGNVQVATAGSATITIFNASTTAVLNGTLKVNFVVLS